MKIKLVTDDDQTIVKEFFVADEYVEQAMNMISEQIRVYVLSQEKEKLLIEQDEELKDRVNAKVAIVS